jgi:hypothetical protein
MPLQRRALSRLLRRRGAAVATLAAVLAATLPVAAIAGNGKLAQHVAYASKRVHAVQRDLDFFLTDAQTLVESCAVARRDRTRAKLQTLTAETATMVANFREGPDRQLALLRGRLRALLSPTASFGVDLQRVQAAARQLDQAAASVQVADGRVIVALTAAGRGDCAAAQSSWRLGTQLEPAGLARLASSMQGLRAL